jgi:phospholipid/cholesterol/gamma-HCH transport system permease protein
VAQLKTGSRPPAAVGEWHGSQLLVRLQGAWVMESAEQLEAALAHLDWGGANQVEFDISALSAIDFTGASLVHAFLRPIEHASIDVRWRGALPEPVRLVERTLGGEGPELSAEEGFDLDLAEPVRTVGRWAVQRYQAILAILSFFGRFCYSLARALRHVHHLRFPALVRQVLETGMQAVPIASLIAFLITVIIAYIGAQELRRFGAEIYVVDLVTVGVLRELGVLLTAVIVAGRSGSAFAAEIGVMKLNEEVDALQAIGIDPVEVLVLPRVLGLMIAMPLLVVIADAVGLSGGGLLCYWLLDIPLAQYVARVQESIASTTFWVGIIKAPVFAFLIAFVGTLRGMEVRDSSRELGRLTTVAVVQSIFLVIFADAIFAVTFWKLDI